MKSNKQEHSSQEHALPGGAGNRASSRESGPAMVTLTGVLLIATSLILVGCSSPQPAIDQDQSTFTSAKATDETPETPAPPAYNSEEEIFDAIGLTKAQRAQIAAATTTETSEKKMGRRGALETNEQNAMLNAQKRQWAIQQAMTPKQHAEYSELMHARRKALESGAKGQKKF